MHLPKVLKYFIKKEIWITLKGLASLVSWEYIHVVCNVYSICWIVWKYWLYFNNYFLNEQLSRKKDLQSETTFLAVRLLDRFLTKGFFTSRKNLQLLGIACLTLAIRIEENQPYNRYWQIWLKTHLLDLVTYNWVSCWIFLYFVPVPVLSLC